MWLEKRGVRTRDARRRQAASAPRAPTLGFFDPVDFPDRAAVRRFVRGGRFEAFLQLAHTLVRGLADEPERAAQVSPLALRCARASLGAALGDLALLARIAADERDGPVALAARPTAPRLQSALHLTALARIAAVTDGLVAPAYEVLEELALRTAGPRPAGRGAPDEQRNRPPARAGRGDRAGTA